MANKSFSSLKDLEKYISTQISSVLQNEVSDEVVDVMAEDGGIIDREVYDKYTPYNLNGSDFHYHRTYELKDKDSFQKIMIDNNTLSVRNIRNENGTDISQVIEYGKGYTWGKASGYIRDLDEEIGARPFHEETKDELSRTGRHISAMKKGLIKRGLDIL